MQCEKTGLWDKVGTVLEIRPDKLSYLIDIEGKLLIRARFMIRPLEASDLQNEVQDQGGAQSAEDFVPRQSERLKKQKLDLPCALPTTKSLAKLREYGRLDRLNWEQMTEEMRLE